MRATAKKDDRVSDRRDGKRVLSPMMSGSSSVEAEERRYRRPRRRPESALEPSVLSRLAELAPLNQQQLLSRIVSTNPTHSRRGQAYAVAGGNDREETAASDGVATRRASIQLIRPKKRTRDNGIRPTSLDDFAAKYARDDVMLRYMLQVISQSASVRRIDIPRCPALNRSELLLEDVLFLTYHRSPPCGFRNLYWLEFISENRALDEELEYFTLSTHGLTHFRGASVIDVGDIEGWIQEKRAFDHMTAMRGLQKLQQLLFFMSWKKKAIRLKHRRIRAKLACSLFHCDTVAARLLVEIRSHLITIGEDSHHSYLPPETTFTLRQLATLHRAHLKQVASSVRVQVQRIVEIIDRECRAILMARSTGALEQINVGMAVDEQGGTRFLERLYGFIRLTDLQVFQAITDHIIAYLSMIYGQVCGPAGIRDNRDCRHYTVKLHSTRSTDGISLDFVPRFSLQHRAMAFPIIYAALQDVEDVSQFEPTKLNVSPAQSDVFDVVYNMLNGYIAALDAVPLVLSDLCFSHVLGPFTPEAKSVFMSNLSRPSVHVLKDHAQQLREMRYAIETYYKQIGILLSLQCKRLDAIRDAERREEQMKQTNQKSHENGHAHLSASQYEEVQAIWEGFLVDATKSPKVVQVGFILLDQSLLHNAVQAHISGRISSMAQELPNVYRQFLEDLLRDMDGRIDEVTRIPTSHGEAIQWLVKIMEMMPFHQFRVIFDQKCANLARMKGLLREKGIKCSNYADEELIHKMDIEWESTYETLLICLSRVQERDSEHRRSILDLSLRAEEHVKRHLQIVKEEFRHLPTPDDETLQADWKAEKLEHQKQLMLDTLESLVEMDMERENMIRLYAVFEREYRMLTERQSFSFGGSTHETRSIPDRGSRLPSELVLQHVSAMFDVRSWYTTWKKLEAKWSDSPLRSVHPSSVLTCIKQNRRRLHYASSKLLPATEAGEGHFATTDVDFIRYFTAQVDGLATIYLMFQACMSEAFTEERWQEAGSILDITADGDDSTHWKNSITLRTIRQQCEAAPERQQMLDHLCNCVIVEDRVQSTLERLIQRLSRCHVMIRGINYRVSLLGVQDMVLELDELALEAKLLMQPNLPRLDEVLVVFDDFTRKRAFGDMICAFQRKWELLCEVPRLHDAEEFFTGQVAWKIGSQTKKNIGNDESVWNEFVSSSTEWNDRVRRALCISTNATTLPSQVEADVKCTLNNLQEAFEDFDFERHSRNFAAGNEVVDKYLKSLQQKCPRLYYLTKTQLLQLLVHEDDISTIQSALMLCYPSVPGFVITRGLQQADEVAFESKAQDSESTVLAQVTNEEDHRGTIVFKGITCSTTIEAHFNVPAVKIGRLKFWITRIDEELSSLVLVNLKVALGRIFRLSETRSACYEQLDGLFPQSIHLAMQVLLTNEVSNALLEGDENEEYRLVQAIERVVEFYDDRLQSFVDLLDSQTGLLRFDPRIESAILIVQYHADLVRRLHTCVERGDIDEAHFIWELEFKVNVFVDDGSSTRSFQRIDICDGALWQEICALGATHPIAFCWNVAQIDYFTGREYVGMNRISVISPLTQRCVFAIMRAIRANGLTLISPTDPVFFEGSTTVVNDVARMLMKPTVVIECATGSLSHARVENLLQQIITLDAFAIFDNFARLASSVIRLIQEKSLQMVHEITSPVITRQACGIASMPNSPVMFVPCGTWKSISVCKSAFQPLAVMLPAIRQFTMALAMLAGAKNDKLPSTKMEAIAGFFESLARCVCTASFSIHHFAFRVLNEVTRQRDSSRVLLPMDAKASKLWALSSQRRKRITHLFRRSLDGHDNSDVVLHTIFRRVIEDTFNHVLLRLRTNDEDLIKEKINRLLDRNFPQAAACEMSEKACGDEEGVCDALEMSLEDSGFEANPVILQKCMELWTKLRKHRLIVVYGAVGDGKSVCIKTLHHALRALELTMDDRESPSGGESSLTYVSSVLLDGKRCLKTDDHSIIAKFTKQEAPFDSSANEDQPMWRQWLCLDGVLTPSWTDLLAATLLNGNASRLCTDVCASIPRLIFETINLSDAPPSFLVQVGAVFIPSCISVQELTASWQKKWKSQLRFAENSTSADNVSLICQLIDAFLTGPVRQLISEEESKRASPIPNDIHVGANSFPSFFGFLPTRHLTECCLNLATCVFFMNRAHLADMSSLQVARLVGFCVVWGFAGHQSELIRQKLDQKLQVEFKTMSILKHLGDSASTVYETAHHMDFWNRIQLHPEQDVSHFDYRNDVLIVPRVAVDQIRISRLLIQTSRSFLIAGSRGSGKTSFLRILNHLNEEDMRTETMMEASLDNRQAPEILDWLRKPSAWFERPSHDGLVCRAADEARLTTPRLGSTVSCVFLDDIGLDPIKPNAVDEFVRVILNHHSMICWKDGRVKSVEKAIGGAVQLQSPTAWMERLPLQLQRVVRHFTVLQLPFYDRKELVSIFRQKHQSFFPIDTKMALVSSGEKVLSLPEISLRASIDLALDCLVIQQTSEQFAIINGFTFNLHHLNTLLERSFRFTQVVSSNHGHDAGTNLLALGKLHQCWVSEVRHIFLQACVAFERSAVQDPQESDSVSLVTRITEVQKVVSSLRAASEKHFSVPVREEPQVLQTNEIVYFAYAYIMSDHQADQMHRTRIEELVTTNASASSSVVRRNTHTGVLSRSEYAIEGVRELVLDQIHRKYDDRDRSDTKRLKLSLELGSADGLRLLVHILHGISCRQHLVFESRCRTGILERLLKCAYQLHGFSMIELRSASSDDILDVLMATGAEDRRCVLWLEASAFDLSNSQSAAASDFLMALAMGHTLPTVFKSRHLRDTIFSHCVQSQRKQLRILSEADALEHFSDQVSQNLRVCVFVDEAHTQLLGRLKCSSRCLWVAPDRIADIERYVEGVARQATREISGSVTAISSTREQIDDELDWLLQECHDMFKTNSVSSSMDPIETCLSMMTNFVAQYQRRQATIVSVCRDREAAVKTFTWIRDRIPHLLGVVENLKKRIQELGGWQRELTGLADGLKQKYDSLVETKDEEDPDLSESAKERAIAKAEHVMWANSAMIEEYDITMSEFQARIRDIESEIGEWEGAKSSRESLERCYYSDLEMIRSKHTSRTSIARWALGTSRRMVYPQSSDRACEDMAILCAADMKVRQLWHARFPFLSISGQCGLLAAVDAITDRIPVIIDATGLLQQVLVHIFSCASYFGEGCDERRVADASDEIAIVVHCDGSAKMWHRLDEARLRDVPVLLVGAHPEMLEQLAGLTGTHRKPLLSQLTLELFQAYERHKQLQSKRNRRREFVVLSDMQTAKGAFLSHVTNSSTAVSTTAMTRDGIITRRRSIIEVPGLDQDAVYAPKPLGFQLYAVTCQPFLDQIDLMASASFAFIQAEWSQSELETSFLHNWLRKVNIKLFRECQDAEEGVVASAHAVEKVESTLWPFMHSMTSRTTERSRFLSHLAVFEKSSERRHLKGAIERVEVLEDRRGQYRGIAHHFSVIAACYHKFALMVWPSQPLSWTHRSMDQLIERVLGFLSAHERLPASMSEASCNDVAFELVVQQVLAGLLASLLSTSHQSVFLLTVVESLCTTGRLEGEPAPKTQLSDLLFTRWMMQSFITERKQSQGNERSKQALVNPDADTKSTTDNSMTHAPSEGVLSSSESAQAVVTPSSSETSRLQASTPSAATLVERLRRKVRLCSLLFEQMGSTRVQRHHGDTEDKSKALVNKTIRPDFPVAAKRANESSPRRVVLLEDTQRAFRNVGKAVKTLWCEWRLVREDFKADFPQVIASVSKDSTRKYALRRLSSVKDLSSSVSITTLLTPQNVQFRYGVCVDPTAEPSIEERMAFVMITKVFFPHRLSAEMKCLLRTFKLTENALENRMATSQLLSLTATKSNAKADITPAPRNPPLSPLLDLAWRKDDLVHLPTTVLIYEPHERQQIDLLLFRATRNVQHPLRLITIHMFDELNLRTRVLDAVTSKVCFAIELWYADNMEQVVALVSQIINQHALLCIPEWYLVLDTVVFSQVKSTVLGYLHVHVVREDLEPHSLQEQVRQKLVRNGVAEVDALTASSALLADVTRRVDSGTNVHPQLSFSLQEYLFHYKSIAGAPFARQKLLKRALLIERPGGAQHRTQKQICEDLMITIESVELISDFRLLGANTIKTGSKMSLPVPLSIPQALEQLQQLVQTIERAIAIEEESVHQDPAWPLPWWSLQAETLASLSIATKLLTCMKELQPVDTDNRRALQDRALVAEGLFPLDWLWNELAVLRGVCTMELPSIAHLLVLLTSRLGFVVDCLAQQLPTRLNLALLSDPRSFLVAMQQQFAQHRGIDPNALGFTLELASTVPEHQLKKSPPEQLGTEELAEQSEKASAKTEVAAFVVQNAESPACSLALEGLVLVQRVVSKTQTLTHLHVLPPCRLECKFNEEVERPLPSEGLSQRPHHERRQSNATMLSLSSTRLVVISSLSPYQTLPEMIWHLESPLLILERVAVGFSVFTTLPGVSAPRQHEKMEFALAVPLFPNEVEDQYA